MAISKLEVGVVPLGVGGDSLRSAAAKINTNFSDTTHAASKIVGTGAGQIPIAQDMYKAVGGIINVTNRANGDVDTFEIGTKCSIQSATNEPPAEFRVGNRQWMIDTFSVLYLENTSAKFQMAYGRGGNKAIAFRNQLDGTYTDWVNIYTNANTKKDSKTNLLIESADSIPNSSAASRLVGTGVNEIPTGADISESYSSNWVKTFSGTEDIDAKDAPIGTWYYYATASKPLMQGSMPYARNIITTSALTHGGVMQFCYPHSEIISDNDIFYRTLSSRLSSPAWIKIYTDKNTSIVNGNLKPSSPVVKIHTNSLELNYDAERMGVTLNKRGVGDYLLQNTTGLRKDDGWYIELPQDVNGNPYFAVTYNQLENNDIEVKTYKRIFDMNTFMFGPDLDSPVDIKEGRSIAIRFNDLPLDDIPQEQLDEPNEVINE